MLFAGRQDTQWWGPCVAAGMATRSASEFLLHFEGGMDSSHASFLRAVALRELRSSPVGKTWSCRETYANASSRRVDGDSLAMEIV